MQSPQALAETLCRQILAMINDPAPLPRLRVVFLPNKPWKSPVNLDQLGNEPDRDRLRQLMEARGIDFVVVDPLPPPYNPWGRRHPFLAGLDPVRSFFVLIHHRSADLVISVFESGAVVLLLLRRLFFFKPSIALWDASVGSKWRPRRLALRFVLPLVDKVFLLSRRQKFAVEQEYKLRSPADVIGYAVDDDFFHPGFNHDADHILSVGDDISRDYPTLIAAVEDLPIALVLRSSSALDVPERSAAIVNVVSKRISFLQLRELYASASIVVIPLRPSDHPSGITSLFEAMAMGKPIIVSDVQMIREFITAGETGEIVPVGDAAALRDAIKLLLERPDEQHRLGRNARLYLEANLTMASFADRYAACIRKLCIR